MYGCHPLAVGYDTEGYYQESMARTMQYVMQFNTGCIVFYEKIKLEKSHVFV